MCMWHGNLCMHLCVINNIIVMCTFYKVCIIRIDVANRVMEKQKKLLWKGSSQGVLSSYPESYFPFLVESQKL